MPIKIIQGESPAALSSLAAESISCVITDPPYGLHNDNQADLLRQWAQGNAGQQSPGFNGLAWDTLPPPTLWAALMPKLKPGAFLFVFAGSRTYHLMAASLVLAGFEIRDSILAWVYGTGFGKHTTLDRVMRKKGGFSEDLINQWQGWAQGLKPATEPIIVARKPFKGACLDNVLRFGTGALNIDKCRTPSEDSHRKFKPDRQACRRVIFARESRGSNSRPDAHPLGRWPKNVVFAHHPLCVAGGECHFNCQVAALAEQSGEIPFDSLSNEEAAELGISPCADRYFSTFRYKSSERRILTERHAGCEDLLWVRDDSSPILWRRVDRAEYDAAPKEVKIWGNIHPTVKPGELMEWLVNLGMPAGGLLLDPFAGSGSTLVAAARLGFDAVGVEMHAAYVEIIEARLAVSAQAVYREGADAAPVAPVRKATQQSLF